MILKPNYEPNGNTQRPSGGVRTATFDLYIHSSYDRAPSRAGLDVVSASAWPAHDAVPGHNHGALMSFAPSVFVQGQQQFDFRKWPFLPIASGVGPHLWHV